MEGDINTFSDKGILCTNYAICRPQGWVSLKFGKSGMDLRQTECSYIYFCRQ